MSISDSSEKINSVADHEYTQDPSVWNRVRQFLESDKGKDVLVVIIVILLGLGSFELGRLSTGDNNASSGVKIESTGLDSSEGIYQDASVISSSTNDSNLNLLNLNTNFSTTSSTKNFFGSKRGHKYYTLGCSAGKSIKSENRVYFDTRENAEKAGYTLSTSCN
jgi:hypothetical protein